MNGTVLRALHWVGLTNLTDAQVRRYAALRAGAGATGDSGASRHDLAAEASRILTDVAAELNRLEPGVVLPPAPTLATLEALDEREPGSLRELVDRAGGTLARLRDIAAAKRRLARKLAALWLLVAAPPVAGFVLSAAAAYLAPDSWALAAGVSGPVWGMAALWALGREIHRARNRVRKLTSEALAIAQHGTSMA